MRLVLQAISFSFNSVISGFNRDRESFSSGDKWSTRSVPISSLFISILELSWRIWAFTFSSNFPCKDYNNFLGIRTIKSNAERNIKDSYNLLLKDHRNRLLLLISISTILFKLLQLWFVMCQLGIIFLLLSNKFINSLVYLCEQLSEN